jgi:hypothetical protein
MRSVLAGVSLPVVFTLLLVFAIRFDDGERVTVAVVVTASQSASIDLVRRAATRDLTGEGARLAACGPRRLRCSHVPLAHLAYGSRAAGRMLMGLAAGLPAGNCRAVVLGSGNTLALLSSDADEMWRALGDRSRSGRRLSFARYASIGELIGYAGGMLRGPGWAACTPPPG